MERRHGVLGQTCEGIPSATSITKGRGKKLKPSKSQRHAGGWIRTPTKAAAVGRRVLDAPDTPAFWQSTRACTTLRIVSAEFSSSEWSLRFSSPPSPSATCHRSGHRRGCLCRVAGSCTRRRGPCSPPTCEALHARRGYWSIRRSPPQTARARRSREKPWPNRRQERLRGSRRTP